MFYAFEFTLGNTKKYQFDEGDFFTYASDLTKAKLPFGTQCMKDDFIYGIQRHFNKIWDISTTDPYHKVNNLLKFGNEECIVRFDNPKTYEHFSVNHDFYNNRITLKGVLSEENCTKLDVALKEYGRGLEDASWLKKMNFSPKYEYLKKLTNALEEQGLLTAYRHKDKESVLNNRDCLIITTKQSPEISINIPLENRYKDKTIKKSRAVIIHDLQSYGESLNPQKDTMIYLTRLGHGLGADYFDYDHPVTQECINNATHLKKIIQDTFGKEKPCSLTAEEKSKINNLQKFEHR